MDNITSHLLVKHYNYDVEEWVKQGANVQFDSGKEQRIVGASIPAISLRISYRGLTVQEYDMIRALYENNHSNTFIVDLDSFIDKRPDVMDINSSVWVFKEFEFTIDAQSILYSGSITLLTSVFFNYPQYQYLFSQSSGYTAVVSTNQDFVNLLDEAPAYKVDLKYDNNALFSNIGQSARHIKNKGGLKRVWTMYWVLTESQFIKLLTFYRKKSGIMGDFGMPYLGTDIGIQILYLEADYIEDQNDYIYYNPDLDGLSKARFMADSFKYQKRVDGIYMCQAEIIEVK
jgi:hypothetical protein